MTWFLFALLSALFAGLVALFGKIGMKDIDSTLATTLRSFVMFAFLICMSFALGRFQNFPVLSHKTILFIILSGIAGALSWLAYFFALKLGPASKVAVIDRLSIVFVIVFAALFLSEALTWKVILGAFLVVAGSIIIIL